MGLFLIFYKKAKKFLLAQKDKKYEPPEETKAILAKNEPLPYKKNC